jgi:hypothetical protein
VEPERRRPAPRGSRSRRDPPARRPRARGRGRRTAPPTRRDGPGPPGARAATTRGARDPQDRRCRRAPPASGIRSRSGSWGSEPSPSQYGFQSCSRVVEP